MSKPTNDMSGLFRSLRPNASGTQAAPAAVAQAAEQRWPLLKAIAPRSPTAPPALSQEDKARWSTSAPVSRAEKRPALSMPGLGDKLTKSLGKMGGRVAVPPLNPVQTTAYEVPAKVPKVLSVEAPGGMPVEEPVRQGLFTRPLQEPVVSPAMPASVTQEDDSLVNIFGRLAQADAPVEPVAPRKSSFLSRIGRR